MYAIGQTSKHSSSVCRFRGSGCVPRINSTSSTPSSSSRSIAVHAKKGGAKKSAQKKGGSALADLLKKKEAANNPAPAAVTEADCLARPEQYADPDVLIQLMMITQAYKKQYNEYVLTMHTSAYLRT